MIIFIQMSGFPGAVKSTLYYNEMMDYIASVRNNPDQDKETLYLQKVKKAMVENGEADDPTIMEMINDEFLQAPRDLDTMEEDLQAFGDPRYDESLAIGKFTGEEKDLEKALAIP